MTRLGIQISSVKKYLQTPEDLLASYKKVAAIGYRAVQNQWIGEDVPYEFVKDALAETGLTCIGTQDYTDVVLPRIDDFIRMNKLWGSNDLCISGVPKEAAASASGIRAFAGDLRALMNRLEGDGMILSFHPKREEYDMYGTDTALDILLEELPNPFRIVLDIYHVVHSGQDPAAWLRKLSGRVQIIHCKDGINLATDAHKMTPTGQGEIDWAAVVAACRETGVEFCLAEQEAWEKDAFECLKESYEYLGGFGLPA